MIAWLGLGGNLGDPERAFIRALETLEREGDRITGLASLWRTAAIGPGEQPDHLNSVARLQTSRAPGELLVRLKELEREAGRVSGERWGPRPLDLDLLLLANDEGYLLQLEQAGLEIPHPRMSERAFVLQPLQELDPGLPDQRTGGQLAQHLQDERVRSQVANKLTRKEPWYPAPFVPLP